ncbi:MAG TPA: MFS transporter [Bacteroidales bacterium]|nr:MFS transporter [Bacteroidales bacterium]
METNTIKIKKEPSAFFRWLILALISFAMFGNYYIYDSISPLADLLVKQLNFTDQNIGLLQGIYSFPNIIMVLIGGIIIDRIGTKKSALLFTILVFIGSIITAISSNFSIMVTGRLIFGLGAESMIVAITTVIARWFKGKELSLAFGLNLTIARLGSFLALNSPSWGKGLYETWKGPLLITVIAGFFAVVCLIIYYLLDAYASKNFELKKEGPQDKIAFQDIFKYNKHRIILASILVPVFFIILWQVNFISFNIEVENILKQIAVIIVTLIFIFLNFKSFSKSFWFISCLCVVFYSAIFPFQTFAIKFFQDVHQTTREVGGGLSSILTLSAMIFTPLFGLLADRIGKRSFLMMIGSLLIIPVYLIMAYKIDLGSFLGLSENINISFIDIKAALPYRLIIPMSIMGIAFSLVPAVMWPSVALVVQESKLGTAYGLMTMIQNIGLFGFNIIIGFINDLSKASATNPQGYIPGMWIFSICGFLGLFFAFMLRKNEKGINSHGLELGSIHTKKN